MSVTEDSRVWLFDAAPGSQLGAGVLGVAGVLVAVPGILLTQICSTDDSNPPHTHCDLVGVGAVTALAGGGMIAGAVFVGVGGAARATVEPERRRSSARATLVPSLNGAGLRVVF